MVIIVSCTARAPWSRHSGQVGESKARKRIFSLFLLNWFLSGSKAVFSVIILFDGAISTKIDPYFNSFSTNHIKRTFTFQVVHHLADISQASPALRILVGAVATTDLLLCCDFFNDQRSPGFDEILFDIIYSISETITYKIICLHLCCSMGGTWL